MLRSNIASVDNSLNVSMQTIIFDRNAAALEEQ